MVGLAFNVADFQDLKKSSSATDFPLSTLSSSSFWHQRQYSLALLWVELLKWKRQPVRWTLRNWMWPGSLSGRERKRFLKEL